jgi:26S proteasome regulatory subunit N1
MLLGMTMAATGTRECLKFKLQGIHLSIYLFVFIFIYFLIHINKSLFHTNIYHYIIGTSTNISSWGHEYVRSLSGEISEECNHRSIDLSIEEESEVEDLLALVYDIVPFQMSHNGEAEAVDLLMEVQQLSKIVTNEPPVVDEKNFERVCLYLLRSADFVSDPEDLFNIFTTAYTVYKSQKKYPDALRVALKMDDSKFDKLNELFSDEIGASMIDKKQMALMLARHKSSFEVDNVELNELIGNTNLSERYLSFGVAMDVVDPKTPEDIYKITPSANNSIGISAAPVLSARANLASSFVNGFVNAGFCNDTLMTGDKDQWVKQNKDSAQISAVASLGLVMLWNVDEGINQLDKYLSSSENNYVAGACLGIGIVNSGIRNETDSALALLSEQLESTNIEVRIASIIGLGIAYAGSQKEDLIALLSPFIARTHDEGSDMSEVSLAALSLGIVFAGTCNCDLGDIILTRLMEITEEESNHTMSRFLCLGLGALYLGK